MSAIVTFQILELRELDRHLTAHTDATSPFLVAEIGPRFFGRKASLHQHAQRIDLRSDQWTHAFRVESSGALRLKIELWRDHDDAAPESLALFEADVPYDVEQPGVTEPALIGAAMSIVLRVTVRSTSAPAAVASRNDRPSGTPSTYVAPARVQPLFVVDLTAMDGVHEPASIETTPPPAANGPNLHLLASAPRRSGFRADGGRVHINRAHDGTWRTLSQHVDLTATVTTIRGALPAGAKIRWSVSVPHDAVVEHPQVRREAIAALRHPHSDGFHSTAEDGLHGPTWPGNKGKTRPAQAWEELDGHTLGAVQDTSAETLVRGQSSRVRLHCPHRPGDRFIVTATLVPAAGIDVIEDISGLVTMWHRIIVEYRPLTHSMPLRRGIEISNAGFEPACLQLDFWFYPERDGATDYASRGATSAMTGESAPPGFDTSVYLAYSSDSLSDAEMFLLDDQDLFPNVGEPGFFTLAGALMPHPVPVLPPLRPGQAEPMAFEDQADAAMDGGTSLVLLRPGTPDRDPQTGDPIKKIRLAWNGEWLTFQVEAQRTEGGRVALQLRNHDYTQVYDGADGDMAHILREKRAHSLFEYLTGQRGRTREVRIRGISVPAYTTGESVLVPWDTSHIAGRLAIFSWHTAFRRPDGAMVPGWETDIAKTILHEFTHSVAAPHKCGHWAYRHDSGGSCALNYGFHPVLRNGAFVPHSINHMTNALCGVHLSQIRKTLFQDNAVYQTLHWTE